MRGILIGGSVILALGVISIGCYAGCRYVAYANGPDALHVEALRRFADHPHAGILKTHRDPGPFLLRLEGVLGRDLTAAELDELLCLGRKNSHTTETGTVVSCFFSHYGITLYEVTAEFDRNGARTAFVVASH
jgi:hypothetical protein